MRPERWTPGRGNEVWERWPPPHPNHPWAGVAGAGSVWASLRIRADCQGSDDRSEANVSGTVSEAKAQESAVLEIRGPPLLQHCLLLLPLATGALGVQNLCPPFPPRSGSVPFLPKPA